VRGRTSIRSIAGHRARECCSCRRNFGCGSSREHAPQALKRWGITAVVGESFRRDLLRQLADDRPAVSCATADDMSR
jgi:hypothetical protein